MVGIQECDMMLRPLLTWRGVRPYPEARQARNSGRLNTEYMNVSAPYVLKSIADLPKSYKVSAFAEVMTCHREVLVLQRS